MPKQTKIDKDYILRASKQYSALLRESPRGSHPYVVFLGLRTYETQELLKQIERGISYAAFEKLQKYVGLSLQELAELVQISVRTLNRRKKDKGRFEADESDRLVRLSRIFGKALELYEGDYKSARVWLARGQVGLGGARPLDLVKSEVGAREVEALIGRLEHGVIS
jgi:putative toxin-antitoxin system antitoxin component (TIGR02293 family)